MQRTENDFTGMLVIRKEQGYTSSDVVARLRGILHMRKIGHTGTLDPQAEGVLPVCLGKATKLADLIADRDKEYIAKMRLGVATDTQDMTGSVLREISAEEVIRLVTPESIEDAFGQFRGEIEQIPPMYSAVWSGGRRLYELAREGITVERKPRRISIKELEILKISLPYVEFRVCCSKGTYIRTLCDDIGTALGTGARMEHLLRTRVGIFTLENALTLSEVEALMRENRPALEQRILPVDFFFADAPAVHVREDALGYLRNGNPLSGDNLAEESLPHADYIRVYNSTGVFYALYRYNEQRKRIFPVKMFHETDSHINDRA